MAEQAPQWREEDGDILPIDEVSEAGYEHEAFDPTEYNLIPDAAFRAAERLMGEDAPRQEGKQGKTAEVVKETTPAERLMRTVYDFRFAPQEKRELSDTYDLIGKDLPGGAATHLNIVLKRQDKYVETPGDSVQAIVRRYGEYAENAKKEAGFLNLLRDGIDKAEPHRFTGASSLSVVNVWPYELSVSRPLLHVLKSGDIDAFIHDSEHQPNPLEINYSLEDKATKARLEAMIKGMRASELTDRLKQAASEEKNRYQFWVKALNEARNHTVARGQAYKQLVDLGEIKEG